MASFFRRKRSLIVKLVIAIPALWFAIVIFLSFQSSEQDKPFHERQPHDHNHNIAKKDVQNSGGGVFQGFQNPINKINEMVQPFNPFVTKNKLAEFAIQDSKDRAVGRPPVNGGNPDELIVYEPYDDSGKFRDVGSDAPGRSSHCPPCLLNALRVMH